MSFTHVAFQDLRLRLGLAIRVLTQFEGTIH